VDNTLSNGAPPGPLLDEDRIRAEVSTLLEGLQIPRASYSDVQLQAVQSGILFREPPPPPLSPPPRTPKTKGSVPDLQEEMIEAKLQLAGLRALLNLQDQERKRERERERESEKGVGGMRLTVLRFRCLRLLPQRRSMKASKVQGHTHRLVSKGTREAATRTCSQGSTGCKVRPQVIRPRAGDPSEICACVIVQGGSGSSTEKSQTLKCENGKLGRPFAYSRTERLN
jgi:hypothetical protein